MVISLGMVFGLVGDGKAVEHRRCTGKAGQSQYDFEGRNVPEIGSQAAARSHSHLAEGVYRKKVPSGTKCL